MLPQIYRRGAETNGAVLLGAFRIALACIKDLKTGYEDKINFRQVDPACIILGYHSESYMLKMCSTNLN